jgi:hypothetical protein
MHSSAAVGSGEYGHSRPKHRGCANDSQKQYGDFLENGSYDFDYISVVYGHSVRK